MTCLRGCGMLLHIVSDLQREVCMKKSKRIAILALLLALTVILSMIPLRVSSATLALTLLPVFVLALTQDVVTGLLGGLVMGVTSLVMAFTFGAGSPTAPIFQNPLVSILPRLFVPLAVFGVSRGLALLAGRAAARRAAATSDDGGSAVHAERSEGAENGDVCGEGEESADCGVEDAESADVCGEGVSRKPRAKAGEDIPRVLRALTDAAGCLVGVLVNTGAVLGMMWAIYGGKSVGDTLISPEFMSAMLSVNFVIEVVVFPLITPPIAYAVRRSAGRR